MTEDGDRGQMGGCVWGLEGIPEAPGAGPHAGVTTKG